MNWVIVMFLSDSHSDGTQSLPLLRDWVPSENVLMLDLFQLLSSQAVITDGLDFYQTLMLTAPIHFHC